MIDLYKEIMKAEHTRRHFDPWDEVNPHRTERFLRKKKQLQAEGVWEKDEEAGQPHSVAVLMRQLAAAKRAWRKYQSTRDRDAVYQYLSAVFKIVTRWSSEGSARWNTWRCLRLHDVRTDKRPKPFSSVILCTSDPEKVDSKTRSKWSRALRYAKRKPTAFTLKRFMLRRGGINKCASQSRLSIKR